MPAPVITGYGGVTAAGDSRGALWTSLDARTTAARTITQFAVEAAGCRHAAFIDPFDARAYLGPRNLRPLDRTGQLTAVAAELALADSGWDLERRQAQNVGLVLGSTFCSVRTIAEFDRRALEIGPEYASPLDFANTVINAAAGQAAIWHKLTGTNCTISAGSVSGLAAIAQAADLIRQGRAEALLAGGAEELCFESFYGMERAGLLCRSPGPDERADAGPRFPIPFDRRRNGVLPGEGAALVVLEAEAVARARSARVLGRVAGYASTFTPAGALAHESQEDSLAEAIGQALADAGLSARDIDAVSTSASGSPALDAIEGASLARALAGSGRTIPLFAVKSVVGETLGAAGALQAIAAILALEHGVLPGIARLEQPEAFDGLAPLTETRRGVPLRHILLTAVAQEGHRTAVVIAA